MQGRLQTLQVKDEIARVAAQQVAAVVAHLTQLVVLVVVRDLRNPHKTDQTDHSPPPSPPTPHRAISKVETRILLVVPYGCTVVFPAWAAPTDTQTHTNALHAAQAGQEGGSGGLTVLLLPHL